MMKHRLSMKLLFYIVLCSSCFTLLVTAFQLYMDYKRDLAAIHESIQLIESSYLQALAASAWNMDKNQIRLQLQGALKLQDVKYLEIVEQRGAGEVFIADMGDPNSRRDIFREFSLKYPNAPEGELLIAKLRVIASLEGIYQRLLSRALFILASNAVKMFLASFCIFLIIQFLITRHITKMARYSQKLNPDKLGKKLVLDRRTDKSSEPDELAELVTSFNDMRVRLNNDIKERSRAEKALRQSEKRYRRLVETMTDIVFTLNTEGIFTFLNPEFENLTGYPARDLIGHSFTEILAPEYIESTVDRFRRGLSGETIPIYEVALKHKDGKTVPVELKVTSLIDDHGKTVGRIGLARDIRERKQAEEALRDSEVKYRAMMESMKEPVFICSQDYRVEYMNPFMIQRTGRDATGENCFKALHDLDQKCPWCMHHKTQQGEYYESEIVSPKDNRSYHVSSSPIVHGDGSISKMTVFRDTTDLKKLEARLQRAQKMEAIGTLAGGVAHDLNNILGGLVSYPELLLMEVPRDSPLRRPILTIQRSGEKAAAVVQDLLTLARRGVAVTEVANLNHIISEYMESPEHENLKSYHFAVEVETVLEPDILNISGSSVHLSKTVMNLVSNAAEAMPDGGRVVVSTRNLYVDKPIRGYDHVEEGDYVVLTVSDAGIGISPEDRERIFEPFYTKKQMGRSGTGLGMSVVWGTVKDHKGYIDVESSEGKGTTFTLYFPATREELTEDKGLDPTDSYVGKGESILVVDDVQEQRGIACRMLRKLGYSVTSVSSGEEAVEYVKTNPVDLLVLDMIMDPGIDGLETYRRIVKLYPGQKAIIASGFSENERVKEAQRLGAGAYVKKPFLSHRIGPAIRAELDK